MLWKCLNIYLKCMPIIYRNYVSFLWVSAACPQVSASAFVTSGKISFQSNPNITTEATYADMLDLQSNLPPFYL